jgi:ParB-like chromosome segregation protein Spo0J
MMTELDMAIESIRVDGRHRKDLGDLTGLMKSIQDRGLLNPVTVTEDGRLLAGGRRLAAVRALGHKAIAVRVVTTQHDAAEELRIERDENTERVAMKPSELVSLGKALEELERPKAEARKGQAPGAPQGQKVSSPAIGGRDEDKHARETNTIVAAAVGTTRFKYATAKKVVEAADDPKATEEERAVAQQAVKDMDAGRITIGEALTRIKSEKRIRLGREEPRALQGARKQRAGMKRTLPGLLGMASAFDLIMEIDPAITDEEVRQWVADLSKARLSIERLIKRLNKERNSEQP